MQKTRYLLKSLSFLSLVLFAVAANSAIVIPPAPSVAAEGYVLMDYETNKIIAEQNADIRLAPASLTKMMTA